MNNELRELADAFNSRIQRKYGQSRRQKFEIGEASKLLSLPEAPYQFGEWKTAKVHPDCHIQIDKNFYSAPHLLRGKEVEVRLTTSLVEIYSDLECVARHIRARQKFTGQYLTKSLHLPESHRALCEATPQRAIEDAAAIGSATETVIKSLIEDARHPLMHLRRVQGILRLAKRYSKSDLEKACEVVVKIGTQHPRLADIEALIKTNLDPKSTPIIPIERRANPFLRGQETWRNQGVIDDESRSANSSND